MDSDGADVRFANGSSSMRNAGGGELRGECAAACVCVCGVAAAVGIVGVVGNRGVALALSKGAMYGAAENEDDAACSDDDMLKLMLNVMLRFR